MTTLQPNETELVGRWIVVGGRTQRDAVAERIEALVAGTLEKVAMSNDGWSTLFQDPADGRFWELWYPEGQMHGGGPPALRCMRLEDARLLYRW